MPARQTKTHWYSGTPDDLISMGARLLLDGTKTAQSGEALGNMAVKLRCLECTVHIDVPRDSKGFLIPDKAYATHEFTCPSNARLR